MLRWKALFTGRVSERMILAINHFDDMFRAASRLWTVEADEKLSLDLSRIQSRAVLSSHYFDPLKRHAHEKKSVTSNNWHWWINGLLAIQSGETKKFSARMKTVKYRRNRKTVEIPIGHSSARKQRAQNFSVRKNQKSETEEFYIIILLGRVRGGALSILQSHNNTTKYASAVIAAARAP